MNQHRYPQGRPSVHQLEQELLRIWRRRGILRSIRMIMELLLVVAAAAVLVLTLWLPIQQVQRDSMHPTLKDGEVVAFITTGEIKRGDVIAFYYGNQVLIKRVVAVAGDWVDIDEEGTVLLNNAPLDEPYVTEHGTGGHDIETPMQVSENQFFVLGDNRLNSLDSRSAEVGTVGRERVVGKALFRVWPLSQLGLVR